MIKCPNCKGEGYLSVWDLTSKSPWATKRIDCGWCKGAKEIDPEQWVEYQPHKQRPKEFIDIRLRDGVEILCCYPNADSWNPMYAEANKGVKWSGALKDHRVTHVRLSKHSPFGPED